MKKLIKYAAALALVLIVLLAGAFAYLKIYFTPEKIKSLIVEKAEKSLDREIRLERAEFTLKGFSLGSLEMSERPDFKAGKFLEAREFSMFPSLSALFGGKIRINSVYAGGVTLRMKEVGEGKYNFSDILKGKEKGKKQKTGGFNLTVSKVKVENANLLFESADGFKCDFKDIALSARNINAIGYFPFEAETVVKIEAVAFSETFSVKAAGKLKIPGFNPEKGDARIERGRFSMGGVKGSFEGKAKNLFEPLGEMDISVNSFDSGELRAYAPAVPPGLTLPGTKVKMSFKFRENLFEIKKCEIKSDFFKADISGDFKWKPVFKYALKIVAVADLPAFGEGALEKIHPSAAGLSLPPLKAKAEMFASDTHASLKSAGVELEKSRISARCDMRFSPKFIAKGRIGVDNADLAELASVHKFARDLSLSGKAEGSVKFSVSDKIALEGNLGVKNVGARYLNYAISGAGGKISFSKNAFSLKDFFGEINGSPFRVAADVSGLPGSPAANFDVYLKKLGIPKIKPSSGKERAAASSEEKADFPPLSVKGKIKIDEVENPNFTGKSFSAFVNLKDITPSLDKIGGSSSFEIRDGKVSDIYQLVKDYKSAKIILYPVAILQKGAGKIKGLPDFNVINYSSIKGKYLFSGGIMTIASSDLRSDVADVSTGGKISLPRETLDLRIDTRLNKKSGISMSAPVGIIVEGTFNEPKVKPDLKSIIKQPKVKQVIDDVKDDAKKLLKKLFK